MAQSITTWRIPAVLWKAFKRLGYDADRIIAHANLPDSVRHDPLGELTTEQAFSVWRALADLAQEPLLGFKLMKAASRVGTDGTFLAASRAATFDEALRHYLQTRSLHSPARVTRERDGEIVRFTRYIPGAIEQEPDVAVDFTLGTLLALGRVGTGVDVKACELSFTRTQATSTFHEEFFGCRIRYKSDQNSIAFRLDDLRRPFISHDHETLKALTAGINVAIQDRHAAETFERMVKAAIKDMLPKQSVTLPRVAGRLSVSARSLQRRIADEGHSFSSLVADVRREIASNLLATTPMKLDAVAAFVGYNDTASFMRAFRSWEGMTPTEWRESQTSASGAC